MRGLLADARIEIFLRDLSLFALGDAMQNEVCLQPMRRQSRCAFDQLLLFFLQHVISDTALPIPLH